MIIVTDSGILGSITNPRPKSPDVVAIKQWAVEMHAAGHTFAIPAIADYETRRELLRGGSAQSLIVYDAFCHASQSIYLSINDAVLLRAAELWAQVRNMGKPTTSDKALDGDVILCAQVIEAGYMKGSYVVATTNTKHLTLFVDAAEWQAIKP
jgi:hypothetical protein